MPDYREADAVNPADAGDQRRVIGERPVAVKFGEVGDDPFDVVQRIGTPRMAREQNPLPGRQVGVELCLLLLNLLLEPLDLVLSRRLPRAPPSASPRSASGCSKSSQPSAIRTGVRNHRGIDGYRCNTADGSELDSAPPSAFYRGSRFWPLIGQRPNPTEMRCAPPRSRFIGAYE